MRGRLGVAITSCREEFSLARGEDLERALPPVWPPGIDRESVGAAGSRGVAGSGRVAVRAAPPMAAPLASGSQSGGSSPFAQRMSERGAYQMVSFE